MPTVDVGKATARASYRRNVRRVVRALASFNVRNPRAEGSTVVLPFRKVCQRPAVAWPRERLDVSTKEALELQAAWDRAEAGWSRVWEAYTRLPMCLCHHDPSPGNLAYVNGRVNLLDFGMSGIGAVGSDMHGVLRWSRRALTDTDEADRLLRAYAETVQQYGQAVTVDDVRLAAWTVFYLRYTNLTFGRAAKLAATGSPVGSGRQVAFNVALNAMEQLGTRR